MPLKSCKQYHYWVDLSAVAEEMFLELVSVCESKQMHASIIHTFISLTNLLLFLGSRYSSCMQEWWKQKSSERKVRPAQRRKIPITGLLCCCWSQSPQNISILMSSSNFFFFFLNNDIKRGNLMVSPSGRTTQLHKRKHLLKGLNEDVQRRADVWDPLLCVHTEDDSGSPGFHSGDSLHTSLVMNTSSRPLIYVKMRNLAF